MRLVSLFFVVLLIPVSMAYMTDGSEYDWLVDARDSEPDQATPVVGVRFGLGERLTSLACRCVADDSCDPILEHVCESLTSLLPDSAQASLAPFIAAVSDPAAGMCRLIVSGYEAPMPPGMDGWDRGDAFPADPVLSIEAVRWRDASQYRYVVRYVLELEEYDAYSSIRFEARGASSPQSVRTLAGLAPVESSSDLPLAASFGSDELFTRACVVFQTVPDGFPREFCTPVVEVDR